MSRFSAKRFGSWAGAGLLLSVMAGTVFAEGTATNRLERMHTKNEGCHWTQEMGAYMYECLKANFNMNAHWCHNEAMEVFCPKQREASATEGASAAPAADKPAN